MTIASHALTATVTGLVGFVGPVAGATPVPEPTAATGPGIWGFLVTFALVLACIPLFLSMTRKVRGVQYRGGEAVGSPEDPDARADADADAKGTAGSTGAEPSGSSGDTRR